MNKNKISFNQQHHRLIDLFYRSKDIFKEKEKESPSFCQTFPWKRRGKKERQIQRERCLNLHTEHRFIEYMSVTKILTSIWPTPKTAFEWHISQRIFIYAEMAACTRSYDRQVRMRKKKYKATQTREHLLTTQMFSTHLLKLVLNRKLNCGTRKV